VMAIAVRETGSSQVPAATRGFVRRSNAARTTHRVHHAAAPSGAWQNDYISRYASSHPWEDFAETWAHYIHIVDALETAYAYGINVNAMVYPRELIEQRGYADISQHGGWAAYKAKKAAS